MDRTYTTISGDTWDMIAKNAYGNEYGAGLLMAANPTLIDTFKFSAGVDVVIPNMPEELDSDLPPWKVIAEEDEDEEYEVEAENEDEDEYE